MRKLLVLVLFFAAAISAWSVGERYIKTDKLIVGLNTAGVVSIEADQGGANNPALRFNNTENKWEKSDDGIDFGSFGGGVGSAAIFKLINADDDGIAFTGGWTTSGGTLSVITTGQLAGKKSYKFAPSAATDETCSPDIELPKRTLDLVGQSPILVDFAYEATDDGFEVHLEDQSNNKIGGAISVLSAKNRAQLFVNLQGTETHVSFCVTDAVHVVSMELVFDDVTFSDEPFRKTETIEINSVSLEGNDGRAITGGSEDIFWSGTGTGWTGGADGQPSYYTVQKNDSVIQIKGQIYTSADNQEALSIYLNGSSYRTVNNRKAGGLSQLTAFDYVSTKGEFSVGDQISIRFATTQTLNTLLASRHYLNINEQSTNESVVVQNADGSEWTNAGPVTIDADTTNPTKGTTTTDKFWWRRVGDSMECRIEFHQSTAGTNGSGRYLFKMHSGYKIDTSKLTSITNEAGYAIGTGYAAAGISDARVGGRIAVWSEDYVWMNIDPGASQSEDAISNSNFGLGTAGRGYTMFFTVPIQGWSATEAHILDIADPYENVYSARVSAAGSLDSESASGTFVITKSGTGRYTVDYSSLGLTEVPSIQVQTLNGTNRNAQIENTPASNTSCVVLTQVTTSASPEDNRFHIVIQRQGADYKFPQGYFLGEVATDKMVEMVLSSTVNSTGNVAEFARTDLILGKVYCLKSSITSDSNSIVRGEFLNGSTKIGAVQNNGGALQSKSPSFCFKATSSNFDLNMINADASNFLKGNGLKDDDGSYIQIIETNTLREVSNF